MLQSAPRANVSDPARLSKTWAVGAVGLPVAGILNLFTERHDVLGHGLLNVVQVTLQPFQLR